MAEDANKDTSTQQEGSAENNNENKSAENTSSAEKKYSDTELNNIVAKKEGKAIEKFLKGLGITDRSRAEEILKQSAESKKDDNAGNDNSSELVAKAVLEKENALLQTVLLTSNVQSAKVEKAVKLIDLAECRDEDGEFSKEKAKAAVEALLKDWPELANKKEETDTGFKIGADGQDDKGKAKQKTNVPKKSWNRFN